MFDQGQIYCMWFTVPYDDNAVLFLEMISLKCQLELFLDILEKPKVIHITQVHACDIYYTNEVIIRLFSDRR